MGKSSAKHFHFLHNLRLNMGNILENTLELITLFYKIIQEEYE